MNKIIYPKDTVAVIRAFCECNKGDVITTNLIICVGAELLDISEDKMLGGREFYPAPEYAYKDYVGLYCSYKCYNKVLTEREQKREAQRKETEDRRRQCAQQAGKMNEEIKRNNGRRRCTPVCQYTLDMQFVARFSSVIEAAESTCIPRGAIYSCVAGTHKSGKGFIWKYDKTSAAEKSKAKSITKDNIYLEVSHFL